MFIDRCLENETTQKNMNFDMCSCPVMECPQERICHINTCHDVEHIVPINTRVINHHVYRHFYKPVYTCTYQDEYSNCCSKNL